MSKKKTADSGAVQPEEQNEDFDTVNGADAQDGENMDIQSVIPEEYLALKQELDALKKEYETQKDQFLRMAAEYDNYRKRTEKEKLAAYDNAVSTAVEAFLPVVDNFALALDAGQNMPEQFRQGLELIQKKIDGTFEKLRVKEFGERGDKFDPAYHNAISRVDDPEIEEDHIASVYQKGYMIGDKIIRHAMVQISNGQ